MKKLLTGFRSFCHLDSKVNLLITDVGPELNTLQGDFIHIRLHGLKGDWE